MLVAKGHPEVVVLVQENLLNPGFPDAARLVPGKRAGAGRGRGARSHMAQGGDTGQVGAVLGSASDAARLFQFDLIPTTLYPFIGWEEV